jgi:peptidyl-prolyl cis-trans isomerase D
MKRQGILVLAAAGALSACDGFKEAMSAHADTVAKAGAQELSVERLATLMGRTPQIPIQGPQGREVAKNLANLWVDYQLLASAAAAGDSLAAPATIDKSMWAIVAQARIQKLGQQVLASTPAQGDTSNAAARYGRGELLSARHILFGFPGVQPGQPAPQAVKDSVRRRAEAIRGQVTVANFGQLAQQHSSDGSAQRGGDLGIFPKGAMVPPFEQAVNALQPGQIAPGLVETPFGYHIVYRPTYAEVSGQFAQAVGQRGRAVAESTYLANLETTGKIDVKGDAPLWTKAIAGDVEGHLKDDKVLATSTAGDLRASRVAQWLGSLPQGPQLRAQIQQAPDSLVKVFVKQLARNEVLLKQADSAKITLDTAEVGNMRRSFTAAVTNAWSGLGVQPAALTDTAAKQGEKQGDKKQVAAARVEDYLDRLTQQRAGFVEVPVPISRALRDKYEFRINDAGIDRALERAAQVRASTDSARTAGQPATAVPLPGGPALPGGAAGGAAPPTGGAAPQPKQP